MRGQLIVPVSRIPPEGVRIEGALSAEELHLDAEDSFTLEPEAHVDVRVEKGDDESVHVRGKLGARLRTTCERCLKEYVIPAGRELDLYYLPQQAGERDNAEDEVGLSDHEIVVAYYEGDRLDLGEALREHFVLGLPMKKLCREECAGLCAQCGKDLNEGTCQCPELRDDSPDPRLAGLKKLLGGDS